MSQQGRCRICYVKWSSGQRRGSHCIPLGLAVCYKVYHFGDRGKRHNKVREEEEEHPPVHTFEERKCAQKGDIWKNTTATSVYEGDKVNKTLAVGTNLRAFPRNLRSGLPWRKTGQSKTVAGALCKRRGTCHDTYEARSGLRRCNCAPLSRPEVHLRCSELVLRRTISA